MREILFKAKRVDNGKEVVGSLVVLKDKCFIFIETKPSKVKKLSFVTHKLIVECVEVVPETVGQYTGLCDKNGKNIFEGDIVKLLENKRKNKCFGEIKYKGHGFYLMQKGNGHLFANGLFGITEVEVIGSMHDNK